ncbi:MAG: hypothetical protein ACMG6H_09750 [Acidobacteriota bacterium]
MRGIFAGLIITPWAQGRSLRGLTVEKYGLNARRLKPVETVLIFSVTMITWLKPGAK